MTRRGGDCSILVVAGGGFGSVASDIAVVVIDVVVLLVWWPGPVSVGLEVVGLKRFGSGEERREGGLWVVDWGGGGGVDILGWRGRILFRGWGVGLQGLGWGKHLGRK